MVSHWSLSDNKSPQVYRTLLSIMADLNNAVVWMVSTRPLISKSSSPYTHYLVTVPRAPITIVMFHSFFNSLTRSRFLSLFHILSISLWGLLRHQSSQFYKFSFFVDYYKIWLSGWDLVICLYLKIPEEFVHFIL